MMTALIGTIIITCIGVMDPDDEDDIRSIMHFPSCPHPEELSSDG